VLEEGGDLLNDIGALPTDENARLCAASGAALLIMHTVGQPKVPHTHVGYPDVWATLEGFFEEKIAMARAGGVPKEAILLDPGIDFAKQRDDNLRIYRELERLHRFGRPILLPVSRKTVIGEILGGVPPAERDPGTVACIVAGLRRGAQIFRVHHVRAARQAILAGMAVFEPAR
jgi:dihydropteroate synthase